MAFVMLEIEGERFRREKAAFSREMWEEVKAELVL